MMTAGVRPRSLAIPGVVGPGLFYGVMLLAGAITPDYDALAQFGSELSIGPLGWIMTANFIVFGVSMLAFALGLWRGFGPATSGRVGAVVIAVAGIGLVLAGIFATDPEGDIASTVGAIHVLASVVVFLVLTLACFAFAWRFRADRAFAVYSLITGILIPPLFLATPGAGDLLGLVQRILIAIAWTWLTLLAVRLYRREQGIAIQRAAAAVG